MQETQNLPPQGVPVRVRPWVPKQPQHEAAYNRDALAFYGLGENVERKGRVETYLVRAPSEVHRNGFKSHQAHPTSFGSLAQLVERLPYKE